MLINPDELQHTKGAEYLALVDTGAKRTSVDTTVAKKLGFALEDWTTVVTAAGDVCAPIYETAMIHVPGIGELRPLKFLGANLRPNHECDVLIGRDILAGYQLIYDGRTGRVTLSDEATPHSVISRKGVGGLSGT